MNELNFNIFYKIGKKYNAITKIPSKESIKLMIFDYLLY